MISGYESFDAIGLAELIGRGDVTPIELLEAAYAAIIESDPELGAITHRFFELGEAQIAVGIADGPFRGVPLFLKDAGLSAAGTPMNRGSRLYSGTICEWDDTLAVRLKGAGFLPVARSKSPELSLSFTTEPEAFGPTRNPWAKGRSPGGSSGGAAAAVASGMVPIAHASDGAGSIRVPAAHCGLFGFKPSRMRNPVGPRVAESNAGMGTPHAITRTVRDSAALLDATHGPDIGDPYAVKAPRRAFLAETKRDPEPLRIGLVTLSGIDVQVDPQCLAAVTYAAGLCTGLGHHVEAASLDYDAEALKKAWRVVAGAGLSVSADPLLAKISAADARERIEAVNLEWIEEGRRWSAADYTWAVGTLHRTGRAMGRFFERFNILLSPVTAQLAPPLGELAGRGLALDPFYDRFWAHAPFTPPFNASGFPAMSVPLYWTEPSVEAPLGLPVGVQFGAGPGDDGLLFSLAAQLERLQPWFDRRPGVGPAARFGVDPYSIDR